MIIPKNELPSSGVLRMAATREIKRKVDSTFPQSQVINIAGPASKRDPSLNIIDHSIPGSKQPKTIRIVAGGTGPGSVKETAESVKVSADGYLIISGKNSGIKVSENTKIVIQPPGAPGAPKAPSTSQMTPQPGATPPPQSGQVRKITIPVQQMPQQVKGSIQDIVNQAAASNQPLTPEFKKKLEIAQRLMVLDQHKKKYIEQQQKSNGPAKVLRTDSSGSQSDRRSIEERLRDPNVNIDNQLGSVSQNVVSNVNIASDILDTYYSVLNDSKTKAPVQNSVPVVVNQGLTSPMKAQSLNTGAQKVNLLGAGDAPNQTNISQVSSPGTGASGKAFETQVLEMLNTAKAMQQQQQQQQQQPQTSTSSTPSLPAQLQNMVTDQAKKPLSSVTQMLTGGTPISDLMKNAIVKEYLTKYAKGKVATSGQTTVTSPIEALLTKGQTNSPAASVSFPTISKTQLLAQTIPNSTLQVVSQLNTVGQVANVISASQPNIVQTGNVPTAPFQTMVKLVSSSVPQQQQQTSIQQELVHQRPILPAPGLQQTTLKPVSSSNLVQQIPVLSASVLQQAPMQPVVINRTVQQMTNLPATILQQTSTIQTQPANTNPVQQTPILPATIQLGNIQQPSSSSANIQQAATNFIQNLNKEGISIQQVLQLANKGLFTSQPLQTVPASNIIPASNVTFVQSVVDTPSVAIPTPVNISSQCLNLPHNVAEITTSHSKSNRQNLFDMFETSTDEEPKIGKDLAGKLRSEGVKLPPAATVNFGSPLKTASVMEALKSKLHTFKPDQQVRNLRGGC